MKTRTIRPKANTKRFYVMVLVTSRNAYFGRFFRNKGLGFFKKIPAQDDYSQ